MKRVFFVLFIISSLSVFGCNFGKPAYNDIQVDSKTKGETPKAEQTAAQNPEAAANPSEDPIAKAEREAGIANTVPPPPPQINKEIQMPSFLVAGKTEIKDLPKYKKSVIINAQIGPLNGVNTALLIFESRDSVEMISEFYEKSFKSNRWDIVTKVKNPDSFEYTLMKGHNDEALVRVRKDPQTGSSYITLSRMEKPTDQKVAAPTQSPARKK